MGISPGGPTVHSQGRKLLGAAAGGASPNQNPEGATYAGIQAFTRLAINRRPSGANTHCLIELMELPNPHDSL
jgi:hypothetical protein